MEFIDNITQYLIMYMPAITAIIGVITVIIKIIQISKDNSSTISNIFGQIQNLVSDNGVKSNNYMNDINIKINNILKDMEDIKKSQNEQLTNLIKLQRQEIKELQDQNDTLLNKLNNGGEEDVRENKEI